MKDTLRSSLQKSLESQLLPNEKILWQQQPDPAEMARRDLLAPLAGIGIAAFAVVWVTGMISQARNHGHGPEQVPIGAAEVVFLTVWSSFFAFVAGMAILAPLFSYLDARKTIYVITDQRALKLIGTKEVTTFSPLALSRLKRTKNKRGFEDVIFYRIVETDSKNREHESCIGFEGLRDARPAERLMLKTFQPV